MIKSGRWKYSETWNCWWHYDFKDNFDGGKVRGGTGEMYYWFVYSAKGANIFQGVADTLYAAKKACLRVVNRRNIR